MKKLAILGGEPVRSRPFPAYVTVGEEEKQAVCEVIDSGCLSKYLGSRHAQFMGGVGVQALEREWAEYFGVKHAIAVNSCTSGLYCAVGAVGVEPGEEIIVTPYTMSATATSPLIWNAIPVFADIETEYYCLDPQSIEERIGPKTRAIIVVDLFGHPYAAKEINALAEKHGLYVIEDTAQAPGAMSDGVYAGVLGDIGVFSLNYHKHIHCGEGGVIVTDNDDLAARCRLIRNHAEAVVDSRDAVVLSNMVGYNFRMTEMEAAVARCQLKKLSGLNALRKRNVALFEEGIKGIPAISTPKVREGAEHVHYVHACKFDDEIAGVSRNRFIAAVAAELPHYELRESEGVKISCGYVKPLYLQPIFQNKIAYGTGGYPFNLGTPDYSKGTCPNCERMHEKELFCHEFILPSMSETDIADVVTAFDKVWENRSLL